MVRGKFVGQFVASSCSFRKFWQRKFFFPFHGKKTLKGGRNLRRSERLSRTRPTGRGGSARGHGHARRSGAAACQPAVLRGLPRVSEQQRLHPHRPCASGCRGARPAWMRVCASSLSRAGGSGEHVGQMPAVGLCRAWRAAPGVPEQRVAAAKGRREVLPSALALRGQVCAHPGADDLSGGDGGPRRARRGRAQHRGKGNR